MLPVSSAASRSLTAAPPVDRSDLADRASSPAVRAPSIPRARLPEVCLRVVPRLRADVRASVDVPALAARARVALAVPVPDRAELHLLPRRVDARNAHRPAAHAVGISNTPR